MGARSNQPASVSNIARVSGSSPVAHGTLHSRKGLPVQRTDERGHDRRHDGAELIDLPPEISLLDGERVHDLEPLVGVPTEYFST